MSVKAEILKFLEMNRGTHVSGEGIARALGVSRSAVWKAIHALEGEGHVIDAVQNRGYMLAPGSDILSAEAVSLYLRHKIDLTVLEQTDTTNRVCIALANDGAANGTSVIADMQTGGKGRRGKSFYSPAGKGVYLSMVIKPSFDMSKSVLITVAASVAVAQSIETVCGITPEIKWVNDVYVGDKKVCGILCEAVTDFESGGISTIVPGIGINCRPMELPDELKDIVGYVPGDYSRNRLAAEVIDRMIEITDTIEDRGFIEYYRAHSMIIGKEITVIRAGRDPEDAVALGIDDDGGLIVRYGSGIEETLNSGEVSIRKR